MDSPASPWWSRPWVWWATFVFTLACGLALLALALTVGGVVFAYVLGSTSWVILGLFIWRRRPSHPIGPMLTIVGLLTLSVTPGFLMGAMFIQFEATITPRAWPMVVALTLSGAYSYLFLLPILLFPEGRAITRTQRWAAWLILLAGLVAAVSGFLSEPLGPIEHPFADPNVARVARDLFDQMTQAYGLALLAVFALKVVEYRRSESVRRAQLKWLVYVLSVYLVVTIISFGVIGVDDFGDFGLVVDAFFIGLIPAAMAIAILRYRLYEIDRIVSRTVSYTLLVIVIAAVFALPVILVPTILGGSSDLLIAGATLAAAAAFNPARRLIQDRVDRRFNRSRYDAELEVEALTARMATSPDQNPTDETLDLVRRLYQPASIGLWVRG